MTGLIAALCLPLLLLVLATFRNIRRGINLSDEGYLVYGTQALLRGEIPIRDFRAYDPGRYYWCALWFRLLGPGFITVRVAMAALSAASVVLIIVLVEGATGNPYVASATGCLSLIWMRPSHKQVEVFFSIVCCSTMYAVLSGIGNPFLLGAVGGVAAAFGLNILVYFAGSAVLVLIFGAAAGLLVFPGMAAQFAAGLLSACAALIAVTAMIPGGVPCYLERKVLPLWRRGASNLPLPKPWIWASAPPQFELYAIWQRLTFRLLFTLLPILYGATIILGILPPQLPHTTGTALVLASACSGLIYFHHFYSRADLEHAYQVMQPLIILCAGSSHMMFGPFGAVIVLFFLVCCSIALLRHEQDFIFGPFSKLPETATLEMGNDRFLLHPHQKNRIERIGDIVFAHSGTGDVIFAAPVSAGLLALFNRRTAVYDTFPVYKATRRARDDMLREFIKNKPNLAIISNLLLDGRQDLLFENNYPELATHIHDTFERVLTGSSETVYLRR